MAFLRFAELIAFSMTGGKITYAVGIYWVLSGFFFCNAAVHKNIRAKNSLTMLETASLSVLQQSFWSFRRLRMEQFLDFIP